MIDARRDDRETRVLFLAPTSRDAELTRSVLERAGVCGISCSNLEHVCRELDEGGGAVLLAEEIVDEQKGCLIEWLQRQPPWSDMPVLVLARPGADSANVAQAMDLLGNVTVLERPTRVAALVSVVRSALRSRQRQYQARDHLIERERTAEALREADRRKDEFLAILAHELRNPLAPIRNSLHILRLSTRSDPSADRVSEMMERQVEHLVRLVDDLMEVSRISRGKIELRTEPVELAAVVRGAVETSRPLIEGARHQLALSIPTEPLTVEGDSLRLTQVVSNLLNNAAKYTDAGGQIWLSVRREKDRVAISVRDTGRGIPLELQSQVFDLFTQVDRSAARTQGGLGIGLTLVKSLVELHGGSISVHSDGAGQGSEFIVRLPLAAVRDVEAPQPMSEPASLFAPRRVLVVDDNRDAATTMSMLLKLLGTEVRVAHSGAEALAALAEGLPDLVLLDLGMPGMDGYAVAHRIRQEPDWSGVTLVALTGWGQDEDRRRTEAAGFNFHLVKPADVRVLNTILASVKEPAREVPQAES